MKIKSKVRLCPRSLVFFIIYGLAFFITLVLTADNTLVFCSILGLCVLIVSAAGIYAAGRVIVDDNYLTIKCMLCSHRIFLTDVREVGLYQPVGPKTIFGSFGFLGYWGVFQDTVIGRYRAFYGHPDDTFLVTLKDGRRYVLGCVKAAEMVRFINAQRMSV